MKRIIFVLSLVVVITSCHRSTHTDWHADEQALEEQLDQLFADTTLSATEQDAQFIQLLLQTYESHKEDSLGLKTFTLALKYEEQTNLSLERYESAPEWIQKNESVQRTIKTIKNIETVVAGMPYKEVKGIDAVTGEEVCLSQYFSDKPVVVDFWASWCRPCREEIKNHLLALYGEGKVQIIGIAVWENTVADTQLAMKQLGITWPVIYTGGREDSPSIEWGVLGIPTLFELDVDGTILASGHSLEDLPR